MSSTYKANSSDPDNLCVVCFKNVEIFSVGCCDHAVCFECSTRMRILCKQNECPICRRDLPKVLFTKKIEPFSIMFPRFERSNLQDRKFGIIFCTHDIQKYYQKLLEHRCYICDETQETNWAFKSFQQLKDHMRREHELFYCDICSEHLKIFSFERKCYNRQELGHHRRKGDKNNTSHRGHPLCKFCDTRFMDNDELFRHLRRNHLFCHFCDADGKHQYYNTMEDLKRHFRDEHFLCEEGECKTMPLTGVFRTEIDLKAHKTTDHSRFMTKSDARQARMLEVEFTMAPRPGSDLRYRRPIDRRERFEDEYTTYNVEPGGLTDRQSSQPELFVNPLTSDNFPALGGSSGSNPSNITLVSNNYTKFTNSVFNRNDFPTLGGSSGRPVPAVTITANSSGPSAPEVTITRTVRKPQTTQKQKENFPALGGPSKQGGNTVRLNINSSQQQTPKVSIHVNQKSNGAITTSITTSAPSTSQRTEVFPALGKTSQKAEPVAQPKWVQHKPKKQEEIKSAKAAPSPVLEPTDLNSFPSLSKSKNDKPKKKSSVTVPVDNWVNLSTMKNSKSNKKGDTTSRAENENKKGDISNKGNGDTSNAFKKAEPSKKGNSKTTDSSEAQSLTSLETQLHHLKFLDVKKPEDKNLTDDSRKSKKKKNKNTSEPSSNNNETNRMDDSSANKTDEKSDLKDINQNENRMSKNGMIKKRSELKIGNLSNTNSATLSSLDDFPALTSSKAPPGFSAKPPSTVKPPPGFNSSNFPSLSNDLTFTNSSGQSYAISPTKTQPIYKQPNNFQSRNQQLIRRFMEVLNNGDSLQEFKILSDKFRVGEIDARKYHAHCRDILGNKYNDIFPELLVLLPDIDKQQELYKEISGKGKDGLIACENCQQVLFRGELSDHYNHHRLENHFPSLGSAQQITSAWKK